MKYYVGVKVVQAEECYKLTKRVRDGYEVEIKYQCGSWYDSVEKGYEAEEGYMVTYRDGYKSFCPKAVFEKYNLEIGDMPRVEDEMVERFVVGVNVEPFKESNGGIVDIEGSHNAHILHPFETEEEKEAIIGEAKKEFGSWLKKLVLTGLNGFRKPQK